MGRHQVHKESKDMKGASRLHNTVEAFKAIARGRYITRHIDTTYRLYYNSPHYKELERMREELRKGILKDKT